MIAATRAIWLIIGMLAQTAPLLAAEPKEEELPTISLAPKHWPAVKLRFERIQAELKAPDFASQQAAGWATGWAGLYTYNGAPGRIIDFALTPKSGVAYTCSGCLGVYGANEAEIVAVAPDGVTVRWAFTPEKSEQSYLSAKLFFVRWGERQYLVPEGQMLTLIAHYNQGGRARGSLWGMPLRRDVHPSRTSLAERAELPVPPGRPQLPPSFARYVVEKPTRLTVRRTKIINQKSMADGQFFDIAGEVELVGEPDSKILVGAEIDWDGEQLSGTIKIDKVDANKLSGTFRGLTRGVEIRLPEPGSEIVLPGADPQS